MRLLKDEEIKFSADKFLVIKWLFAKTNEHFRRSTLDLFLIMRAIFYENFEALHLNHNEQRANEKKTFLVVFIFFLLNKFLLN